MTESELISQGSYGCVYKPGLKCNSNEKINKKEITKLQLINKFSLKEMKISDKIINEIKGYKKYYAPIKRSCEVDIKEVGDKIKECKVVDNEEETFILNRMDYAGDKTLINMLFETKKKSNSLFLRHYFLTMIKLFDGIERLNKINIIHLDIKGNNVIYSEAHSNPIIIDFGLSLDLDDYNDQKDDVFFTYGADYEPWCIDLGMITYIIENKIENVEINDSTMKLHIEKVIEDYVKDNTSVLEKNREDMKKRLIVYFGENFMNKNFGEMIEILLKNAKTWDVHSLIVVYYHFILSSLSENDGNINLTDNTEIGNMIDDMESYILSVPDERESLEKIREKMMGHYKNVMLKEKIATKLLIKKEISEEEVAHNLTLKSILELKKD